MGNFETRSTGSKIRMIHLATITIIPPFYTSQFVHDSSIISIITVRSVPKRIQYHLLFSSIHTVLVLAQWQHETGLVVVLDQARRRREVSLHHLGDKSVKVNLALPSQLFLSLRRVAEEETGHQSVNAV